MINIKKISKKFGQQSVFENIDLELKQTGIVFITGPSGSGKSTLMNMLAAYDLNYDGEIVVNKLILKSSSNLDEYRRTQMGFIFQNFNLINHYTVLENCLISIDKKDDSYTKKREEAISFLSNLGVSELANQNVETLSGGEKQRVAIARALLHDPKLILADEPTGSLDEENTKIIMKCLRGIAKNKLVIMITHDESLIQPSDTVLKIENLKITEVKPVENKDISLEMISNDKKVETKKNNLQKYSTKNCRIYLNQYLLLSIFLSIALCSMLLSNNASKIMDKSIQNFKDKNISLHTGYIKVNENEKEILSILNKVKGISHIQNQYKIDGVTLTKEDNTAFMDSYYPMSRAEEDLSFGRLPCRGKAEIAINPSLAHKLTDNIKTLVGEKVNVNGKDYTVSGIFNAGYDSFYISQDNEAKFFKSGKNKKLYAITYDVDDFNNIINVNKELAGKKLIISDASQQVKEFINNFNKNTSIFKTVSLVITCISSVISIALLFKVLNSRKREFGLLNALGFNKHQISLLVSREILLVSITTVIISLIFSFLLSIVFPLAINYLIIIFSLLLINSIAYILMQIILRKDPIQLIKS